MIHAFSTSHLHASEQLLTIITTFVHEIASYLLCLSPSCLLTAINNHYVLSLSTSINLQTEFAEFIHGMKAALVAFDSSPKGDIDQFKFWDASNYAREQYRALTNTTFTGEMAEVRRAF